MYKNLPMKIFLIAVLHSGVSCSPCQDVRSLYLANEKFYHTCAMNQDMNTVPFEGKHMYIYMYNTIVHGGQKCFQHWDFTLVQSYPRMR